MIFFVYNFLYSDMSAKYFKTKVIIYVLDIVGNILFLNFVRKIAVKEKSERYL